MELKDQRKNRYKNRKEYSKEEIERLAKRHLSQDDFLINPLNGKKYTSEHGLFTSMGISMEKESIKYYKYLVLPKKTCDICKDIIKYDDYRKHNARCSDCRFDENGKIIKYVDEEALKIRGERISKAKIEFYKTERGAEVKNIIGEKNSVNMKNHFATDTGKEQIKRVAFIQSEIMKEKIRNGEFTPNITNTWTNWDSKIYLENGAEKKFRSSWEACFWFSNQELSYETFRIPYELDGSLKTYIADFHDEKKNIIYEIKPKSQWLNQSKKMQNAIEYCMDNNIAFVWINEYNIMEYVKPEMFSGENYKQLEMMMRGVKTNEKIDH